MTDPRADAVDEGRRVGEAALAAGVALKLTGGVAVALRCPSANSAPLQRDYADVDIVGRGRESGSITELLGGLGYEADTAFNAMHGRSRLYFWDPINQRQLDVFLDEVEMCHRIDLRNRLGTDEATLSLADLLLMKLQIVETNHKDYLDILTLLIDQQFGEGAGIDLPYLASLAADDWGLWKTTTTVAERAADYAAGLSGFTKADLVRSQVDRYIRALDEVPKSRRWKLRAKIGERKRWYEIPEEAH